MKLTVTTFWIAVVLYFISTAILITIGVTVKHYTDLLIVSMLTGIFGYLYFVAVRGLKQKQSWAWGLGVALSVLSVFSFLFPLGVLGLAGLFSKEMRAQFA